MVTDVIIIYNSENQISKIKGESFKISPFFTFINEMNYKSRKEAIALKSYWAAKDTPFIICKENDKVIKIFYSETGENVIESLINYLNE